MLLVALPRKKYEVPEEALIPGSLWGSVALAGGIGFLMVNIGPMIMSFFPGDNDLRTWLDLALLTWFFTAAVRASVVGTPKEIEFIANKLHGFYSEVLQELEGCRGC